MAKWIEATDRLDEKLRAVSRSIKRSGPVRVRTLTNRVIAKS